MLALALAESAQQASAQTLKRPGASQAGYTHYGDTVATAEDKLPSPYSSVALDKAYFQTDRAAEQFHLQNNTPGNSDQPLLETAAIGEPPPSHTTDSGEQLHQLDLLGNQSHRNCLSGDPEKVRIASAPLPDSEKSDDLGSFPEDQAGKPSMLSVSFAEQDQSALHFCSEDPLPSYLGISVDKSHHPSELAGESPLPSNLPRDKIYLPSGSPEENTSTATLAYMTVTPTAAEMSPKDTSWAVAEQPAAADFATATVQRSHRTPRPLPAPPTQRPAEQPPVMGQVQAATSIGVNNSHKVRKGGTWQGEV